MLSIGICGQRVNAISALGEVILRQGRAIESSRVTACFVNQRSECFAVAYQRIICHLQACAEGEDTGGCLSGGQITACGYQTAVYIVIIVCAVPKQGQLDGLIGQIQFFVQVPDALSCPIILLAGFLMDSAHTANLLFFGHVQIELDHFLTVIGHQTEFRITLIRADAGDLHRHLQLELSSGETLNIGIQRCCLFRIHNQIGVISAVSAHIQRNTGMAVSGAAKEVTVRISHVIRRRHLIFFGQAKSSQYVYILRRHGEGLLAFLTVCSQRNQLIALFRSHRQCDLIALPGLGMVSCDLAVGTGEDIDKIHTRLSLRYDLSIRRLRLSARRLGFPGFSGGRTAISRQRCIVFTCVADAQCHYQRKSKH